MYHGRGTTVRRTWYDCVTAVAHLYHGRRTLNEATFSQQHTYILSSIMLDITK